MSSYIHYFIKTLKETGWSTSYPSDLPITFLTYELLAKFHNLVKKKFLNNKN